MIKQKKNYSGSSHHAPHWPLWKVKYLRPHKKNALRFILELSLDIISILVQKYIQIINEPSIEKPGSMNSTSNLLICDL